MAVGLVGWRTLGFCSRHHAVLPTVYPAAGAHLDQVESANGWAALIWAAKRGHKETVG